MDKEKLNTFIQLLQKVQKQPSRTFDLGLIVKEPKSKIDVNEVFDEVKKLIPAERIVYDKSVIDEDIFEKIIKVFEENKWIFLEIRKDISSPLLNQLKYLVNYNSLKLLDYREKDVFEMKMPESSRVVVYAERDFIENKITYPYFYRLFGPILSLN